MILPNIPAAEYHARPELSSTRAKRLLHTCATFRALEGEDEEDKECFAFGKAVHFAVLEPEKYEQSVAISPAVDRRTKAGKDAWAYFQESAQGRTIITQEQHDDVRRAADAVRAHPKAWPLLRPRKGSLREVTLTWEEDTEYGPVACRARPDTLHPEIIVDLKTTVNAAPGERGFAQQVEKLWYHLSADWYMRGARANGIEVQSWVWVAVEKGPVPLVAVYQASERTLEIGRNAADVALARYAKAVQEGKWPGYDEGVMVLDLPPWAANRIPSVA